MALALSIVFPSIQYPKLSSFDLTPHNENTFFDLKKLLCYFSKMKGSTFYNHTLAHSISLLK